VYADLYHRRSIRGYLVDQDRYEEDVVNEVMNSPLSMEELDRQLQGAVLFVLADEYPGRISLADVEREMGPGTSAEATADALEALEVAGLAHRHDDEVEISPTAMTTLRLADCVV
jgi:hypothetical protein